MVVCTPDGEELYRVGGKWDRLANGGKGGYVGDAQTGRVVRLKWSQVKAGRWFARWLDDRRAGKHRDHVLMLGGPRRGGKTFGSIIFIWSLCLEIPGAITWVVSPTIELRGEIDRQFTGEPGGGWPGLPAEWYEYRATPQFTYTFPNGSFCRNLSGAIPSRMKRGKSHGFLINEAQEQTDAVATYAVPSVIDTGGLGMFAANPPDKPRGQWINGFREKLKGTDEEGRDLIGEIEGSYFWVDPALNDSIDQGLRGAVAVTLNAINPDSAKRDAAGLWLPVGDIAYPKWLARNVDKGGMIGPPPDTLRDITNEVLRRCGINGLRTGHGWRYVVGADFQDTSYCMVATIWRVFERPADKLPMYWMIDEAAIEGDETALGDEVLDLDGYDDDGYTLENAVWIPDATGEMQDGKHSKRNTSFGKLHKDGWRVHAPTIKVTADAKNAVNPRIYRRLAMMYKLMDEGRLFVAPRCKLAIEAFSKCPLHVGRYGGKVPYGKHSHITDSAGYPLWKMEPEEKKKKSAGASAQAGSLPGSRPGVNFRF